MTETTAPSPRSAVRLRPQRRPLADGRRAARPSRRRPRRGPLRRHRPRRHDQPAVVEAMAELGIDLRQPGAHPKKLDDAAVKPPTS